MNDTHNSVIRQLLRKYMLGQPTPRDTALAGLYLRSRRRVGEILRQPFRIIEARVIPNSEKLSYLNVGKAVETAILYADVRGSTELHTQQHQVNTAKMFRAILGELAQVARHYGAHIRGFAGDRIMVVLEQSDAPTKLIDISVSMRDVVRRVLNPGFVAAGLRPIAIGIGCDYGVMLAVKVGMQRTPDNSDLIWVGRPANIASKLTDMAGADEVLVSTELHSRVDAGRYLPWRWAARAVTLAGQQTQAYALAVDTQFDGALNLARL